jgi:hypothetical protein
MVGWHKAVVEGDENGADLGDAVVALEEVVGVGAEDADTVAFLHTEVEKGVSELVAAMLELAVGIALVAIDDGDLVGIKLGGAPEKVVDEQRNFHRRPPRRIW